VYLVERIQITNYGIAVIRVLHQSMDFSSRVTTCDYACNPTLIKNRNGGAYPMF